MWKKLLCAGVLLGLWSRPALGSTSTLHIDWDPNEPGHPAHPVDGTHYFTTGNGTDEFPSVRLKSTSLTWVIYASNPDDPDGVGNIGRIWCNDFEQANFGISIANGNLPGARIVQEIDLRPNYGYNSSIRDGKIETLTGKLKLKREEFTLPGYIVGNLEIGAIVADQPPASQQDYQVDIFGGVKPGGRLVIGDLGQGVNTYIGPVCGGGELTIGRVGAKKCIGGPCTRLFIQDPNEANGEIYLGELLPGANVLVSPVDVCPLEAVCQCADPIASVAVTVGRMDGETAEFQGAQLDHSGLGGLPGQWQTLTIGPMGSGARVFCGYVAGRLNLKAGIAAGAEVLLGSLGINLCDTVGADGVVDLTGDDPEQTPQSIHGLLSISRTQSWQSIAGHIIKGGEVSGTLYVNGDVVSGGSVEVGDVSGTVDVIRNIASGGAVAVGHVSGTGVIGVAGNVSGALSTGDVSGNFDVNGSIASGGTLSMGETTSTSSVTVSGGVLSAGSILVGGDLGGPLDVYNGLNGTLSVIGGATGALKVHSDQAGTVDIGGKLDTAGEVTVDGALKGSAQITVNGGSAGRITVNKGTESATKIQARSGLSSGSLINVNATGGSSETVAGMIWIGGSTTQNPMPTLTMDGTIEINCSGGTFANTGKVKLVGCAPDDGKWADICIYGTNQGQIKQTLSCINLFSVNCICPSSSCPSCPP